MENILSFVIVYSYMEEYTKTAPTSAPKKSNVWSFYVDDTFAICSRRFLYVS